MSERHVPLATLLHLAAAGVLGFAIRASGVAFDDTAIAALLITFLLAAAAVFAPERLTIRVEVVLAFGAALVAAQLLAAITASDPLHLRTDPIPAVAILVAACGLLALTATAVAAGSMRLAAIGVVTLILVGIGAWLFPATHPVVDVIVFERVSATTVAHGHNPYDPQVVKFPDLYGGNFYDRSLTDGTRLDFGYPYPPLSLGLVTVAHATTGEVRWANLAGLAAGVVAMLAVAASARSRRTAAVAAAVLLTTPFGWYVIKFGWIEPIVFATLAATAYCAVRRPRVLPYAVGALIMSKQYVPILLPLLTLAVPWRTMLKRAFLLPVVAGAAIAALPSLFLAGYWHSVFVVQLLQPFRRDSLSFAAWWANHGHPEPGTVFTFLPVVVALLVCLWKAPRDIGGYAGSCALVLLAFFGFAKQSFANYQWLAVATLCLAAACTTLTAVNPGATAEQSR